MAVVADEPGYSLQVVIPCNYAIGSSSRRELIDTFAAGGRSCQSPEP
jgi:hypothetical protein